MIFILYYAWIVNSPLNFFLLRLTEVSKYWLGPNSSLMLNANNSGNLKGALEIYTEMKEAHVKPAVQTYTILIRYAILLSESCPALFWKLTTKCLDGQK